MKERFAVPFASIVPDVWGHYLGDVVHRLKGLPMQVIFGEGDVVVPLSSGRLLERACGARLSILRSVGHTPHLEDPDTTWQLVRSFADDVFVAAGPDASAPTTSTTTQTKGV
jgi:pimeloyl-ACP methyl ester carboxylesterase